VITNIKEKIMTVAEARENIGKFAFIVANGDDHYKAVHGRITEVDRTGYGLLITRTRITTSS